MGHYYYRCTSGQLSHSGIIGQKWGVRRYQNADGTYTSEGKVRKRAYRQSLSQRELEKSKNGENGAKERVRGLTRRQMKAMSDEELKAYRDHLNERLNLEKTTRDTEYQLSNYRKNAKLQAKIETLTLKKRVKDLNAELSGKKYKQNQPKKQHFLSKLMDKTFDKAANDFGQRFGRGFVEFFLGEDPNKGGGGKKKKK